MKIKLLFTIVCSSVFIWGCASNKSPNDLTPEDFTESIVQRSDSLKERPSWVKDDISFQKLNGEAYSLGMTVIYADQKIDGGLKIAENNAKTNYLKMIEQKLDHALQVAEEDLEIDNSILRSISTEVSRQTLSGIYIKNRYWEKYVTRDNSGVFKSFLRIYVRASISESILNEEINKALHKKRGGKQFSTDFIDKVNEEWKKL